MKADSTHSCASLIFLRHHERGKHKKFPSSTPQQVPIVQAKSCFPIHKVILCSFVRSRGRLWTGISCPVLTGFQIPIFHRCGSFMSKQLSRHPPAETLEGACTYACQLEEADCNKQSSSMSSRPAHRRRIEARMRPIPRGIPCRYLM